MLIQTKTIGLLLIFLSHPLYAVSADDPEKNEVNNPFNYTIEVFTAHSPYSSSMFAKMKNTQFSLIGFNFGHSQVQTGNLKLFLSSELVLFGRMNFPINGHSGPKDHRTGLGIVPLRLSIPFSSPGSRNFFYADTGLGIFLFEKEFPNPDGANLNVTIDFGFGYEFRISDNNSLSVGYRFHHLSNAGTAEVNPGLDSNMIYLSFKTFR
jgi:hypothetical protein